MSKLPKGAPIVMRNKGKKTDSFILQKVLENPGLSVNEISGALGWTNGRVDGSVNRLLKQGTIRVRHCIRRGILVKKVYPADEVENPSLIKIPKEMIDGDLWKDTVCIYALSRSSIAISARKVEEWERKSFLKESVSIEKDEKELLVKLPDNLSDFYRLENSETSLSTNADFALVTVESTIVPVEIFGTFPALPIQYGKPHLIENKVEGITSGLPLEYYGDYSEDEEQVTAIVAVSNFETHVFDVRNKKHTISDASKAGKLRLVNQ